MSVYTRVPFPHIKEEQMSYHAPKAPEPEKPLDPLINMKEMGAALKSESKKKGYLSTFLSQKRAGVKPQGFLSTTLGNSTI